MRLPALWLVAAFSSGVVFLDVPLPPLLCASFAAALLLAGTLLLRRQLIWASWCAALAAWFLLGGFAAAVEHASLPSHHVARLVDSGAIETTEALRWRGRLRGDPVHLPWGLRYEIALEEVELGGASLAVAGGLRVSYFRNADAPEPEPLVRAGDRVEALVRARPPRNFGNPGAFDARAHMARQEVHLTASLRSTELLRKLDSPPPMLAHRFARLRGRLLERINSLFAASPHHAAVARAMLIGDYNFVDHELAEVFQRTSVYHVLVISGMHVAALAAFVFWLGRRLRMSRLATTLVALAVLTLFVAVVEDRPPIERAAVMALVVLLAGLMFRRVELLNTIAVAALLILLVRPSSLLDPSFQLSFVAAGMIGALALPWMDRTTALYRRALRHLDDVTRDAAHPPRVAQFRLDLRAAAGWLAARLPLRPSWAERVAQRAMTWPCAAALGLWDVVLMSFAIHLGMLALMAHYFHRVTLHGPLANIPATLLAALIVPVGFLALLGDALWSLLGAGAAKLLGWLIAALLASVNWFGQWSWAAYRIPGPPAWLLAGFFLSLALLSMAARRQDASWRRRWQIVLAILVAALAIGVVTHPFAPQGEPGRLEVTTLDVGQGDSLLVVFPDGRTLLIDGGGLFGVPRAGGFRTGLDIGEQVVSPYLWQRGLKRLDVVALTHAHQDHLDGLSALLQNFRVGELWVGRDVASPAFRELLHTAQARGVRIVHRRRGDSFTWGEVTGLVLWPEDSTPAASAANNDSLVLRLEFGRTALLLPGDIEAAIEDELFARGDPLDAGFLKVAHHGSRTSTTPDFLLAVLPQVAVVSVSDNNPFGHPHAEVLDTLAAAGVRLFRTDRHGAITLLTDGTHLTASSYRPGN